MVKMARKQMFTGLTFLLTCSLALSACSSSNNNIGADNGKTTNTKEQQTEGGKISAFGEQPLTFSYYMNYDWASPSGYGTDAVTKWLQEEKKMTMTEVNSNGNAKQKFGTMVAFTFTSGRYRA